SEIYFSRCHHLQPPPSVFLPAYLSKIEFPPEKRQIRLLASIFLFCTTIKFETRSSFTIDALHQPRQPPSRSAPVLLNFIVLPHNRRVLRLHSPLEFLEARRSEDSCVEKRVVQVRRVQLLHLHQASRFLLANFPPLQIIDLPWYEF
ncbi:hypothetical protein PanWU01x14_128630, partial [Parasponia andersonii]